MADLLPLSPNKLRFDKNLQLNNENFHLLTRGNGHKNRLQLNPFPNYHDLAMFAQIVYKKEEDIKQYLAKHPAWKLLATARNTSWLGKVTNGYFGAAFYNPDQMQVVIAHPGTHPSDPSALYTDVAGVLLNCDVGRLHSAVTFAHIIKEAILEATSQDRKFHPEDDLQDYRKFQLSFTGHSLGGWLAQATTFSMKYLDKADSDFQPSIDDSPLAHAHCVAFESPGSSEMLRDLLDFDNRYARTMSLDDLDITNFLSAPNRINMCHQHVGVLYSLGLDFKDLGYVNSKTPLYNIATHRMEKILTAFLKDGSFSPYVSVEEILDWPVTGVLPSHESRSIFTQASRENNFHPNVAIVNINESNYNALRYNLVRYSNKSCSTRWFTRDELTALRVWKNIIVKSGINVSVDFLHYGPFGSLFSEFNIKDNKIYFNESDDLEKTVRNIKQMSRWYSQNLKEIMIKLTSDQRQLIFKLSTDSCLNPSLTYDCSFQDIIGLEDFLGGEESVLYVDCPLDLENYDFQVYFLYKLLSQLKSPDNVRLPNTDIKILQTYANENCYLFLDCKNFNSLNKFINYKRFLINDLQLVIINMAGASDSYVAIMNKFATDFLEDRRKIIFICSSDFIIGQSKTDGTRKITTKRTELSDFKFSHLNQQYRAKALNENVICLQNTTQSLQTFLKLKNTPGDEISKLMDRLLDSDSLKLLISNENICIELDKHLPRICDMEATHIEMDRRFTLEEFKVLADSDFFSSCNCKVFITYPENNYTVREYVRKLERHEEFTITPVSMESDVEYSTFYELCGQNTERQVYWFHIEDVVNWNLLYDRHLYKQRKFICDTVLNLNSPEFDKSKFSQDYFIVDIPEGIDTSTVEADLKNVFKRFGNNRFYLKSKEDQHDDSSATKNEFSVHNFKVVPRNGVRKYVWYKSEGEISNIQDFVDFDEADLVEETNLFSSREDKIWIVIDEPGMGKSSTLTNICAGLHDSWNFLIKFLEYRDLIKDLPEEITLDSVVSFLSKSEGDSHILKKNLLRYCLNKKSVTVFVLLDGFDEIYDRTLERKAIKLLQFIQSKTKAILLVSTRQSKQDILQDALNVFPIKFMPWNESDLREFLIMFWTSCLKLRLKLYSSNSQANMKDKISDYVDKILNKTNNIFDQRIINLVGVPLHIRLLAEVANPEFRRCEQELEIKFKLPDSIRELFKLFIEKKMKIYLHKKIKPSTELNPFRGILLLNTEIDKLRSLASEKYGFISKSSKTEYFISDKEDYSVSLLTELQYTGLIYASGSSLEFDFIHATIKEFFFAEQLFIWLKQGRREYDQEPQLEEYLLGTVFLSPDFKVVRMFLNDFFTEFTSSDDKIKYYFGSIIQKWVNTGKYCTKDNLTPIHVLTLENCETITSILLSALNRCVQPENYINILTMQSKSHAGFKHYFQTALYMACRKGYSAIIKSFISLLEDNKDTDFQEKVLLATFFSEFSSKCLSSLTTFVENLQDLSSLLIICETICDKYKFVERFLSTYTLKTTRKCINDIGNDNYKNYLISVVYRYFSTSRKERSLQNIEDLISRKRCRSCREISFPHYGGLVPEGMNAFQVAVFRENLEIVKYFIRELKYNDINRKDYQGYTVLFYPIMQGNRDLVNDLLTWFADSIDVNAGVNDRCSRRPLHSAVKEGDLDIVKLLVEKGGAMINCDCGNEDCRSVLYRAIKKKKDKIIEYLQSKGAELTENEKQELGFE